MNKRQEQLRIFVEWCGQHIKKEGKSISFADLVLVEMKEQSSMLMALMQKKICLKSC